MSSRRLRSHSKPSPPSATLPDKLITEILSRLPVKSLIQMKSVCKSWKTLISNPSFIKIHTLIFVHVVINLFKQTLQLLITLFLVHELIILLMRTWLVDVSMVNRTKGCWLRLKHDVKTKIPPHCFRQTRKDQNTLIFNLVFLKPRFRGRREKLWRITNNNTIIPIRVRRRRRDQALDTILSRLLTTTPSSANSDPEKNISKQHSTTTPSFGDLSPSSSYHA